MDSEEIDISEFWCWNEDCPDYGKKGKGNIVPKEQYGKDKIWLLKCKTCSHCFSENKGTVFFQLKTPQGRCPSICHEWVQPFLVFQGRLCAVKWSWCFRQE